VGRVSDEAAELLRVTEEALYLGIERARVGGRVSDIGHAVQRHVEAHGFTVVREFVGHGVGHALHEEPQVPKLRAGRRGPRLTEGMTLAIEPMVAMGKAAVKVLGDGWTAVTRDRSLAAHFEHTVAITGAGPVILTTPGAVAGRGRPWAWTVSRGVGQPVPKDDTIEVTGIVLESLPNAMFRVELGEQASGACARVREDAQELHPDPDRRQGADRAVAVRLEPGAHHVPVQVKDRSRGLETPGAPGSRR